MAKLENPNGGERGDTRRFARAIVESVIRDDEMPLELTKYPISYLPGAPLMFDCGDVEEIVLRLAHEIYILTFEREAFLEEYRKPR